MLRFNIGPVSEGTLRTEDLLAAYEWTLRALVRKGFAKGIARAALKLCREADSADPDSEDAEFILDEMASLLNDLAPPYCYFGASDGDGASIGFFISWDAIEDARRCGELASGDECPRATKDAPREFLVVNDHGNATLYVKRGNRYVEAWGCV